MGTWGPGNLDSDGALDEVAEQSTALVARIWKRLQRQESWEADEYDHDALFVDLEVLLALDAAGLFSGYRSMPDLEDLAPVRDRWLAGWDDYFDGLAPAEGFKAERRRVIETTFDRFAGVCARYRVEVD